MRSLMTKIIAIVAMIISSSVNVFAEKAYE